MVDNMFGQERDKLDLIEGFDALSDIGAPCEFAKRNTRGRIIQANTPYDLYLGFDPKTEMIPTLEGLMRLRVMSFEEMMTCVPGLGSYIDAVARKDETHLREMKPEILKSLGEIFESGEEYAIWKSRLTSSTNMVRIGEKDTGELCFYDGFPDTLEGIANAVKAGEISDGGLRYSEDAVRKIQDETPPNRRIPWDKYLSAPGGRFSGRQWLDHLVFYAAVGNREVMIDYVLALQTLRSLNLVKQPHSGWCPREMKHGYGRPISLGFGGDAFYPPNNTTVGHSALVLPRNWEICKY